MKEPQICDGSKRNWGRENAGGAETVSASVQKGWLRE